MESHYNPDEKKSNILSCSIQEDQLAVAEQWAKTFVFNGHDNTATNMMRILMACVAKGDFMVKNMLSKSFETPSDVLTIADYLSHGSRIMIDYSQLSDADELLEYFKVTAPGVFARPSTHDIIRDHNNLVERKVIMRAAVESLPSFFVTPYNYGADIAMGGEGQKDFYQNVIHANGHCGHVYFYRDDATHGLLCGLEQSSPAKSYMDIGTQLFWGASGDQFGQIHSMTGASDKYTAAGSLYFSDPIYITKLACEHMILPPAKYDGMLVTLTDENWPTVKAFLESIRSNHSVHEMTQLLLSKPNKAEKKKVVDSPYIQIDFKSYMKSIYDLWIANNDNLVRNRQEIDRCHNNFTLKLTVLNYPDDHYIVSLQRLRDDINNAIPDGALYKQYYIEGVDRLIRLFEIEKLRLKENGVTDVMYAKRHRADQNESYQSDIAELIEKMTAILSFYQSSFVDQSDAEVIDFVERMRERRHHLQENLDVPKVSGIDMNSSVSMSFVMMDDGHDITEERLEDQRRLIQNTSIILTQYPLLRVSPAALVADSEQDSRLAGEPRVQVVAQNSNNDMEEVPVDENHQDRDDGLEFIGLKPSIPDDEMKKREAIIAPVLIAMTKFRGKSKELTSKGFVMAAEESQALVADLEFAVKQYKESSADDINNLRTFKDLCVTTIDKKRPELYKDLEAKIWLRNLKNFLLGVVLLGVGYGVAISINRVRNGSWMFFSDSTSQIADEKRLVKNAVLTEIPTIETVYNR